MRSPVVHLLRVARGERVVMMSQSHVFRTALAVAGLTVCLLYGRPAAQGRQAAAPAARQANPCAAPANRIIAENCRPGNPATEWDINGDGDPTIQGFSTDVSYNVGE